MTQIPRIYYEITGTTGEGRAIDKTVVSSVDAIYSKSRKALQDLLGCTKTEQSRIGRRMRMTEAAIMGSMEIWREHTQNEAKHREKKDPGTQQKQQGRNWRQFRGKQLTLKTKRLRRKSEGTWTRRAMMMRTKSK
jgi:hypothetical protein